MLDWLFDLFRRPLAPLSDSWLGVHCTELDLPMFEREHACYGRNLIFHLTQPPDAANIIAKGMIFGVDVVDSAHFHTDPRQPAMQAEATGCLLEFIWCGPTEMVDLTKDPSTHASRSPGRLVHVPSAAGSDAALTTVLSAESVNHPVYDTERCATPQK
jgi:hypothetical protein